MNDNSDSPSIVNGSSNNTSSLDQYNIINTSALQPNGNMSYRLVSVNSGDSPQGINIVPILNSQQNQGPQVVFANPTSNDETSTSNRIQSSNAFFSSGNTNTDISTNNIDGSTNPVYMFVPGTDIIQNSRLVGSINKAKITSTRDSNRRTQHNEVERRRRDKINQGIIKLSKIVPECQNDNTKQGQSKGGILAKAFDYIQLLLKVNSELKSVVDNDYSCLRDQLAEKQNQIDILRKTLKDHGIEVDISKKSD